MAFVLSVKFVQTNHTRLDGWDSVNADGSVVVFYTASTNLPGANGHFQVYRRSVASGPAQLVSCTPAGTSANGDTYYTTFHAVSAFCNAGFSLHRENLIPFQSTVAESVSSSRRQCPDEP